TSESVAPWTWPGAIAAIAVFMLLLVIARAPSRDGRRYFWFWVLGMMVMALAGILVSKRIVLLAPWFWLGWGLACAGLSGPWRKVHALAFAMLLCTTWLGILHRDYYSAFRFVEPWSTVAQQ